MAQKAKGEEVDFGALVNRYLLVLREHGCTKSSIQKLARMTDTIGQNEIFDVTRVCEVLDCGRPTSITFVKKLREIDVIERVGRGTFRFNLKFDK